MSRYLNTSIKNANGLNHGPSRFSGAKSARSSFSRTAMGKTIRESSIWTRLATSSKLWKLVRILVSACGRYITDWKENIDPMWKTLMKDVDLRGPTSFLDNFYLGLHSKRMSNKQRYCRQLQKQVWIQNLCWSDKSYPTLRNLTQTCLHGPTTWKVMQRNTWKDIANWLERHCELANKTTQQLYKVSTPCIDDHQFKEEEMGPVGELSKVCVQTVLKWLLLARVGRPDILWSVIKLVRAVTKSAFDLLHSSHRWIPTTLPCGKHSTTIQIRIVWTFWFWRRFWKFKINIRETLMRFRKSHICAKKSDVQENRLQFHTVLQNLNLFRWMQVYAWTEFPRLIFGT